MGTPHLAEDVQRRELGLYVSDSRAADAEPRLAEIDAILADLGERERRSAVEASAAEDEEKVFISAFQTMCRVEARPAMETVLERLRRDGGGGRIEEHPGGEARVATPRLTLWMSLQGEIRGSPRVDRHPYLQLDADMKERNTRVSEGDMWGGNGSGRSGRTSSWELADIDYDRILRELVAIIARSAPSPSARLQAVATGETV